MSDTQQRIDQLVKGNDIVLFMKGTASFPQCGFSGRAVQILKASGVDAKNITTVNVLEDPEIRQGIKDYSQWPTIPRKAKVICANNRQNSPKYRKQNRNAIFVTSGHG